MGPLSYLRALSPASAKASLDPATRSFNASGPYAELSLGPRDGLGHLSTQLAKRDDSIPQELAVASLGPFPPGEDRVAWFVTAPYLRHRAKGLAGTQSTLQGKSRNLYLESPGWQQVAWTEEVS